MSEQDFGAECAEAIMPLITPPYSLPDGYYYNVAKIINAHLARRQAAPEPVAGEWSEEVILNLIDGSVEIEPEDLDRICNAHNAALRHTTAELSRCREALHTMLDAWLRLAESGDAGYWDPETDDCVKLARVNLLSVPVPAVIDGSDVGVQRRRPEVKL